MSNHLVIFSPCGVPFWQFQLHLQRYMLFFVILLIHMISLCNCAIYSLYFKITNTSDSHSMTVQLYWVLCRIHMCVCVWQYGCIKWSHSLSFNHFYVRVVSVSLRYFEVYSMLLLIVFTLLCSRSHDLYPWINKSHSFPPSLPALAAIIQSASVSSASLDSMQWDGVRLVFPWL